MVLLAAHNCLKHMFKYYLIWCYLIWTYKKLSMRLAFDTGKKIL